MFGRLLRARPLVAAVLSAAPLASSQPTQTYRVQQPQRHEERHPEDPPEPAFLLKIDPSFAYSLFAQLPDAPSSHSASPSSHVGVGGLGFGPRPTASSAPASPPPSRQPPSSPVHEEEVTHSLAKTVLSTDDVAPASSAPAFSAPSSLPPSAPPHISPSPSQPSIEEPTSFLAPFWAAVTQHSEPSPPSRSAPASAPAASSASPSGSLAAAAYEEGREVGRLETYREFEGFIQRTEAEKAQLESALRRVERQREEERLLSLKGEVGQVEALKRRRGQKGAVCEEETKRVLMCYRQNMTEVLKCDVLVREFALCADRAKDAVLRGK